MPKLADIANIRNGLAFRGRIEHDDSGDALVLQASDLLQQKKPDASQLVCVQLGKKASRYKLHIDDVVFTARGHRQLAFRPQLESQQLNGKAGLPVITAFGLIMITANQKKVLPAYLHWVLNTKPVQYRIDKFTEGTNMSFISERNLADVEIPVPPLETQNNIAQLLALHEKREQLRQQIASADEITTQTIAWSLATAQPK